MLVQGSARVMRCLRNSRDQLSPVCRATLFDEEVRFSENIDFQYPMKTACAKEMERFCKDVPHGNSRVIRCLQVRMPARKPACRQAGRPHRHMHRLHACMSVHACADAAGTSTLLLLAARPQSCVVVLSCKPRLLGLVPSSDTPCTATDCVPQDNKEEKDFGKACAEEVKSYESEISKEWRFNFRLHKACQKDVEKLCPGLCQNSDGNVSQWGLG